MAGCSSSVKLLCDSGSAVNASDFVRIDPSLFSHVVFMFHCSELISKESVCAALSAYRILTQSPQLLPCSFVTLS